MKKKFIMLMLSMTTLVAGVLAQDEGSKIVVEITKEINGEKKTFKGEYNSTEEMHADPNYQEFAGDEDKFHFWSDGDDDVFLHLDQLKDHGSSFFRFFSDEENEDGNTFFFKHFDGDSTEGFFNFHLDDMDLEEYRERMKKLGIEMEMLFDKMNDDDPKKRVRIIEIKKVKVTDVDDEFGKRGKVNDGNRLELDDLSFYPNPSSDGRLRVKFTVPKEEELSIKVSNLDGKEVFSRYFESFSGIYSETIDLSGQKEGIYLMEISQGKRRLTKKIVIN